MGDGELALQPLTYVIAQTCTPDFLARERGVWEREKVCWGALLLSRDRPPQSYSSQLTLRTGWWFLPKSCFESHDSRGEGEGRQLPKWLLPLLGGVRLRGGRGGRRAAEQRRCRLLGSPSSLALTDGRGAPWGGLPARWGRGAAARPRWGEILGQEPCAAPALPTLTPGKLAEVSF